MSIYLSPQHGVNPALACCFVCNKERGVVLLGQIGWRMRKALGQELVDEHDQDPEAPRKLVMDRVPCNDCKKLMDLGVILLSVDETQTTDRQNHYRTGGFAVVRDEFIMRLEPLPLAQRVEICKKRMAFIPDAVWDALGLPRGEVEGIPSRIEDVR